MHLFLDFDGVLHPDEAYLIKGRPMLKKAGQLFMWADLLEGMIADLPTVQIVLSTSWARQLGYSRAKRYLPLGLRSRVIGATWHSAMGKYDGLQRPYDVTWWDAASRYQQIKQYAIRAKLTEWVAIDDQTQGWGVDDLDKLVQTNSKTGLSDGHVLALLAARLGGLGNPRPTSWKSFLQSDVRATDDFLESVEDLPVQERWD